MPSYTYHARDERGQAVNGTMAAASPDALADQLKRMGYVVTGSRELRGAIEASAWLAWLRPISYDELVLFNIQLSKMIQVGIPLLTALTTLETQTEHQRLRLAIGDIVKRVQAGTSFSEALQHHPAIFSTLFVSMVKAGETSGKLDEILGRLAEFSQRQAELRQQLQTALTYPCLLFVLGIGIVTFLVTGIIPKFMKIFLEAGVELPLPTRILYQLSELIRQYWGWGLVAGIAVVVGLRHLLRTPTGRRACDAWVLGIPVIGAVARKVALSRFARTFETLMSSGVPILEALGIVQHTVGNVIFQDIVKTVEATVRQGGGIAESLKTSGEFPPMAVQMITVGESSGTLDHMLRQLADHYDQLVSHGIKRAMAFVEPLFLGIMGAVVALIMASILLPMFRLVNVVR